MLQVWLIENHFNFQDDCKVDTDYYKCRFGEAHTMAKYGCGAGSKCKDVCSYGFSSQVKKQTIIGHDPKISTICTPFSSKDTNIFWKKSKMQ